MSKPHLLSREQVDTGYERFVEAHPEVRERILAITLELADDLDFDIGELRRVEVAHAVNELAMRRGIDEFALFLQYAVDSTEERVQILRSWCDLAPSDS
ncbi:DUF6388 family protein [Candidatus Burkholderia verschuerenii]|uniref:DUF6388 family protein n=1 Tax=Candidatus Burkholderia verschuerenii TaxID=242163 RepID=UPI00067B1050|nr:DUF6388 family protein [Candidatus Burkholderia verschuerenii]